MSSKYYVFQTVFPAYPRRRIVKSRREFLFSKLSHPLLIPPILTYFQHVNDNDIGVAVIDAFTHYVLEFMEKINKTSQVSMQELVLQHYFPFILALMIQFQFNSFDATKLHSTPGVRSDLFKRPLDKARITDFFGGVAQVEILSLDSATPSPEATSPTNDTEPLQLRPNTMPLVAKVQNMTDTAITQTWLTQLNGKEWKTVRAWASLTIIGALASWVAARK